MLRLILTYLPSRRGQLLSILTLTLLEALLSSVSIAMLVPLTQAVLGSKTDSVWFLRHVPDQLLARPDLLFMMFGCLLVLKVIISVLRQALVRLHVREVANRVAGYAHGTARGEALTPTSFGRTAAK